LVSPPTTPKPIFNDERLQSVKEHQASLDEKNRVQVPKEATDDVEDQVNKPHIESSTTRDKDLSIRYIGETKIKGFVKNGMPELYQQTQ